MVLPDGHHDIPHGKIATVVTHLEMTQRPALRSDLSSAPWQLRRVEKPDLDWFRDLYRRIGTDWLWFLRLQMNDAQLTERLFTPGKEIYALVDDDRDEGLLELQFREPRECEIVFFGVVPNLVGVGAGRWLMNRALELAWDRPIDRLWLQTCTSDHPAAIAFYQRTGFAPFRRQIGVSDDPRLNGTLPREAAAHVPVIE